MKAKILIISLLPFVICASAVADMRIATVDIARVINDLPEAVSKKKELDTLAEDTKKKVENKAKELQALKIKLESNKVAPDSKEAESFRNQARDFERMRGDAKVDLEKKFMKVNKDLTDKVLGRVEEYAKSNNYVLVFDKSDKFRGPVLYGSDAVDITDDLITGSN